MKIKLSDIREATYDAYLDTEYREALAHSLMGLGYVSDSPLNLAMGTQKEKEEIERVERKALSSNQISEIIHLMMYEMRNDFQYGKFKPIALEFLNISEKNFLHSYISYFFFIFAAISSRSISSVRTRNGEIPCRSASLSRSAVSRS